jgi:hypothetical protein
MTAITIVSVLSRTVRTASKNDALMRIAVFCAAGLVATLIVINCGVDLNTGFAAP